MDEKRFWDIIAFACDPEQDEMVWYENLVEALMTLPPDDIVRFTNQFFDLARLLDTSSHRAAARLINAHEYESDEDAGERFDLFCYWVIGEGRLFYEEIRANPDNLADHLVPGDVGTYEAEIEDVGYVAWEGLGFHISDFSTALAAMKPSERSEPAGEDWDIEDEDEVAAHLPRLAALYRGEGD